MQRHTILRVKALAAASLAVALLAWWFSRDIETDHPIHGKLRYSRVLGRIVRVEIDSRRTGTPDAVLQWTLLQPLSNVGSLTHPYPLKESRDVNFDGQWDTWIQRGHGNSELWSVDTNGDGKADIAETISQDSLVGFNARVEKWRGYGLYSTGDAADRHERLQAPIGP